MTATMATEEDLQVTLRRYKAYFDTIDGYNAAITELDEAATAAEIEVEEHKIKMSKAREKLRDLEDMRDAAQKSLLHLLNLAVHPNLRRAGIGRALIDKLIGKLATTPRTSVVVEVRETNIDAQLFFREFRFKAISVLQEHYFDTDEAAYVMEYRK